MKLKVELWAKIGNDSGPVNGKGKERERPRETRNLNIPEWQVLEEWDVDLNELTPLPNINADDVCVIRPLILCLRFSYLRFWKTGPPSPITFEHAARYAQPARADLLCLCSNIITAISQHIGSDFRLLIRSGVYHTEEQGN